MARKTLADFNGDCQKYADYLESAQCLQDEGCDEYGVGKHKYTPTEGDWAKGHGHTVYDDKGNVKYERKPEDPESYGRPWKYHWLKEVREFLVSSEEKELISAPKVYVKK